ncbi:MAG TPA: helicase C-terminal domain-containing protein [Opitutaceae bacterium]|nr:helicase C-terminal domain-containing protein [Opitutaceae bacterium]
MIGLRENDAGPAGGEWVGLVGETFEEGGWVHDALELEHRPEQEQMALEVAEAFAANEPLLFEAGTGVGKSLAYLVPGLMHAVSTNRPMLVSTHTISLQEQIQQKDLELCRRLFRAVPRLNRFADFKSAVLVGKANYLCTTRLAQAVEAKTELFQSAAQTELQRIAAWVATAKDGLRQELTPAPDPEVWDWVHADSAVCSRKNCNADTCFYRRARARIEKANLIIVNHSLLFAHIAAGGAGEKGASRGILFPDDFLVLDEAHTAAEVATEHFGLRISSYGIDHFLKTLYNPARKRGLLKRHGTTREQMLVADCIDSASLFFGFIRERLLTEQPVVRVREASVLPEFDDEPFKILIQLIGGLADRQKEGPAHDELDEARARLTTYHSGIRQFLKLSADGHVHWVERSGREGRVVAVRSAPVDPAPQIREVLFERDTAAVLTSATLTAGGDIEPLRRRVGAEGLRAIVVDSPFDFENNMRVFVASDVPMPTPGEARLSIDALADYIEWCATRVAGGSLVLFTSYTDMNQVAAKIGGALEKAGRPILIQGGSTSRTELTRQFKHARNGVLFGTDSFWTGVDVPGDALAQVIITRLPFDVPSHPVAEARAEWVREQGGNPFNDITLPDALMQFRQGAGRLIRTKTDRGVITVLDSRILHKAYGRLFLDCLPKKTFERMTVENRETVFKPFNG